MTKKGSVENKRRKTLLIARCFGDWKDPELLQFSKMIFWSTSRPFTVFSKGTRCRDAVGSSRANSASTASPPTRQVSRKMPSLRNTEEQYPAMSATPTRVYVFDQPTSQEIQYNIFPKFGPFLLWYHCETSRTSPKPKSGFWSLTIKADG